MRNEMTRRSGITIVLALVVLPRCLNAAYRDLHTDRQQTMADVICDVFEL